MRWLPARGKKRGIMSADMQAIPQIPKTERSSLAIWSLVLGILSTLLFCLFLGLPAIICGHLALGKIRASGNRLQGRGQAIAGLVMGYLGVFLTILFMIGMFAGMLIPAVAGGQEMARRSACVSNLTIIGKGCTLYAMDHQQMFPPDLQSVVPLVGNDAKVFTCRATGHQPGPLDSLNQWTDYVYVPGCKADDTVAIVAFENPGNHGGKGGNVLYSDGSVAWMNTEEFNKAILPFFKPSAESGPER
jgi:prepilin-type processing-associated H-X9-DG protein